MSMMTNNISRCPHVATIGSIGIQDYLIVTQENRCEKCHRGGPHLWLCLREQCLFVGCGSGKDKNDHSGDHEKEKAHPLQFNLTTRRIWCYDCNEEVFLNNDPPFELSFLNVSGLTPSSKCLTLVNGDSSSSISNSVQVNVLNIVEQHSHRINPSNPSLSRNHHQQLKSFEPTLFELEHSDPSNFTRGTSGLYNLGNTCYMNSALQALLNCVPLTSFFLDCAKFIPDPPHRRAPGDSSHGKSNGKLAKFYMKLVETMWIKSEGQVLNPGAIAAEIRSINPSFRSYTQQDAQEFLRCFMDELHSEMRMIDSAILDEKHRTESSSSTTSSETCLLLSNTTLESEYETCSSGLSSSGEDNISLRDETIQYSSLNEIEQYSKRKTHRRAPLSRTDSGVSFNISKPSLESSAFGKATVEQRHVMSTTKTKPLPTHSIISSIFDGRIQSQIECLTCNRRSTTLETFQDLSLPIPSREQLEKFHAVNDDTTTTSNQQVFDANDDNSWFSWFYSMFKNLWTFNLWGPPLTLQDCLQAFFQADELTGDNMYSCEKCGKLRNGMKYCKVMQLPEVLCIHLKRFRHDSMIYTKIGSYVSFPLVDLDMTPFVHKDCASEVRTYDLFSCIVHYGRAGAGHYTTYALNSLNQQWYEYDDETVRPVDALTVQSADAYVLFYRKKEPNITDTYETIRHLLSTDQNCLLPFYISRSWINRLFYFAEPGPISNNDFLCKHGGVLPGYWSVINDLVYPAPESVWQFLHEKYGGSSVCNILDPCRKCQLEAENLKRRQRLEKNTFLVLKQSKSDTDKVFALSPNWYRDWENFVCEKSSEPPGPISNTGISTTKNGVTRLIRRECNHLQVGEPIWSFFLSTYGGGPELLIRSTSSSIPPSPLSDDQPSSSDLSPTNRPPVTFV